MKPFVYVALIQACFFTHSLAVPSPLSTSEKASFARRDDVSIQAKKYKKNCQKGNLDDLEEEAWDTMKLLAQYAQLWRKDGAYQPVADMYFGGNSRDYYDRIMKSFKNAEQFHDTSFFNPSPPNKVYFEIWCAEDGPDGKVPMPDGLKGDWNANECARFDKLNGYSFKRQRWYWLPDTVYYTVLCPKVWKNKTSLLAMNKVIGDIGRSKVYMDNLTELRAYTYLHETLHHTIVSNPWIGDVNIQTASEPQGAYGAPACASLAKWYGCSNSGVSTKNGGVNGEFGTVVNADNYAIFALSIYFQETLSVSSPFEPAGSWRDIPKRLVDPAPRSSTSNAYPGADASLYLVDVPDNSNIEGSAFDLVTTTSQPNSPLCVDGSQADPDQQYFSRSNAVQSIDDFRSESDYWGISIVSSISFGTDRTSNSKSQVTGIDNSKEDNHAVDDGTWLAAKMAAEGCIGSFAFGHGTTSDQKKQYCVDHSTTVLDDCQTDTTSARYGGALQYGCNGIGLQGNP
ncbi:hypothetical protein OCU04_010130 [Sclerotinia nivalis]|uniref:Lysine-specific metallo-endopeptidase domain-containing protein n=1 Tax=Sclerotinia nivalis TaxID=352851 RepID=A0A9X0DHK2_9HELO|nr:hypothetical protein OCU04_010130 [Sclerotinia nivalis]